MNALFRHKAFPLIAQILMLLIFAGLLSLSLGVAPDSAEMVKILRNTNLSNLTVWAYWWSLIIIIAVIFGRWWCTICPLELINSLTAVIGLKRKPGKLVRSGWLITLFYAVILILVIETWLAHRIPHRMALYLSGLFLFALLSGFIWEKRTFCNYICPVGHLLGLYSMLSFFGLKVKNPAVCSSCASKDCYNPNRQYKLTERSCTSNLNPSKSSPPTQCIYCTQCMTACPHDNLKFGRKNPLKRFKNFRLKPAQAVFLLMVSGFLIPELLEDNEKLFTILSIPATKLNSLLQTNEIWSRFIKFVWFILCIPGLLLLITAVGNKLAMKIRFKQTLIEVGLYMLPLIAFLHAYKGLTKMITRIPYLPHVFSDPKGIDTASAIIHGKLNIHSGFADNLMDIAHIFGPVIVMLSVFVLIAIVRRNANKHSISLSAAILYALTFAIALTLQI